MKLKRIRKNALYSFSYGASVKRFKKFVRSSPDNNVKRIPARQLKRLMIKAKWLLSLPLGFDKVRALNDFKDFG